MSTGTQIYMYYGNASASSQQNAAGVWNGGYKIVTHFKEASGNLSDSTGHGNSGIPSGGASSTTAGSAGNGYHFNGSSGGVTINNNSMWAAPATDSTLDFWFKPDAAAVDYANLLSVGTWSGTRSSTTKIYEMSSGVLIVLLDQVANPWGTVGCSANLSWLTSPDGKYHHIALVYTGIYPSNGSYTMYVDGVSVCSSPYTTGGSIYGINSLNLYLGSANGLAYIAGSLDEFRLAEGSGAARSAAWITSEFNNQNAPGSFYTLGTQQ